MIHDYTDLLRKLHDPASLTTIMRVLNNENHMALVYSKEALAMLRRNFPVKGWTPDATEAELAHNAGQQEIIDYIEMMMRRQKTKVINSGKLG